MKIRVWRLSTTQTARISVPVSSKFHFNNIDYILAAVLAGHGLAMLPTYLCGRRTGARNAENPLRRSGAGQQHGPPSLCLLHAEPVRVPKVRAFLAELEEAFNPVPPAWNKVGCGPSDLPLARA